jgi:predicted GNAT family acetyltransferase
MTAALKSRQRELVLGARRPRVDDLGELARLMFAAYQGTIDYTGESVEDATGELTKTFAGAHGLYLPQHSYVVERGSTLVSASLVTRREGLPLLAFAMTAPDWKRKGLARATIGNTMQDLFEAGETRLELVVNAKNLSAYDLYISLGFKRTVGDA